MCGKYIVSDTIDYIEYQLHPDRGKSAIVLVINPWVIYLNRKFECRQAPNREIVPKHYLH